MKRRPALVFTVSLFFGLGLMALWSGCDSDGGGFSIDPEDAVLSVGQSQIFTASGGSGYLWALNPADGAGHLDAYTGNPVTFHLSGLPSHAADSGNNAIEVICWSTRTDESGARVKTDSASAYVFLRSASSSTNSSSSSTLTEPRKISPATFAVTRGDTYSHLSVSGGTSPYK